MRGSLRRATITATVGLVLLLGPRGPGWEAPRHALAQEPSADVRALHDSINALRTRSGCPSLAWNAEIAAVAREHSQDMASRGYFAHEAPDGSLPDDRLERAGIWPRGVVSENLALTPAGPASAFELWRDSPPHRRNLLDCAFTDHGIGRSGNLWTEVLVAGIRSRSQR
jgi:uncharacterized protein YkwD